MQEDTIFISGMSPSLTEDDVRTHFGAIGIIKVLTSKHKWCTTSFVKGDSDYFSLQTDKKTMRPKIWMYNDKNTGKSKGECTVTYDDAHTARSAIQWFDGMYLSKPSRATQSFKICFVINLIFLNHCF